MPESNYVIEEKIAVLSTNPKTKWTREINKISWYGREPKYDIRDWSPDHEKYGKGLTFTDEEYEGLVKFAQGQLSLDNSELPIE